MYPDGDVRLNEKPLDFARYSWDRDYLELCGPATVAIGADDRGEIAFGTMQADLETGLLPFNGLFHMDLL